MDGMGWDGLPDPVERWSLTSLREKVVKIIAHARYTIF
jgi:hypothetical protein